MNHGNAMAKNIANITNETILTQVIVVLMPQNAELIAPMTAIGIHKTGYIKKPR